MNPQITIATFETREPANQLVRTLTDLGIESAIEDETELQKSFLLQKEPHASIHVLVDKHDIERAQELMRVLRASLEGLVRCPQCGKSDIMFPQFTRKFFAPAWLLMLLSRSGLVEPEYFCRSCSWEWSAKLPEPAPAGPHA